MIMRKWDSGHSIVFWPVLVAACLFLLLCGASEMNGDHCAWDILDLAHFEKLCWTEVNGDQYLLGVIPEAGYAGIPGPLFLKPVRMQQGMVGGVGHQVALQNCSNSFASGFPRANGFSIMWHTFLDIFLVTLDNCSTLEEVSSAMAEVQGHFFAGALCYLPMTRNQIESAESWGDPDFPVLYDFTDLKYIPYSHGINFGRLQMIESGEWDKVNAEGLLTREDIVVLQEVPFDFNVRIAGAITCMPQSPLSHVNLICLQEAIPNAYVFDAWEVLAPLDGKLVALEVLKHGYTIREASSEEAEQAWAARRPEPLTIRPPDDAYSKLPSLDEIAGTFHADRFGGKGAYLARFLPNIPVQNRVPGFVIPFHYFNEFMHANFLGGQTYAGYLKTLFAEDRFRTDSAYRKQRLESFQETLRDQGGVSDDLKNLVAARIAAVFGSTTVKVRFRSSSNAEDALFFPGAGLYWSTSACAQDSLDGNSAGPCHCDPTESRERTIGRALRKVWAGLWTFEAFEQRKWHGLDEDQVRMGILVTPAFLDEAANGVALTGSPTDPCHSVFYVTAQVGEESVVEPEPGSIPELNLISPNEDGSIAITRMNYSSMAPLGEWIMNKAELSELGAALKSLADSYTPPPSIPRELVRLDVEFKVNPDRRIRIKQVRPYIIPGTEKFMTRLQPRPYPHPERCYINIATGTRDVFEELADRMLIHLVSEGIALSGESGEGKTPWVDYVEFAPAGRQGRPTGDGTVQTGIDYCSWVNGSVNFRWQLSQHITTPSGEDMALRSSSIRMRHELWENRERFLSNDKTIKAIRDGKPVVEFAPHGSTAMLRYLLHISLLGGGDARFLITTPSSAAKETEAILSGAQGTVQGIRFLQEDPFRLAVGRGTDSVRASYLAITGHPEVYAIMAKFIPGQMTPEVYLLDAQLESVRNLPVLSWSKQLFSSIDKFRFKRGDVNMDGKVNLADAIALLSCLFVVETACHCLDAADANDDGIVDLSDAVKLLTHIFMEPQFGTSCEFDATQDALESCPYLWQHCDQ